MPKPGHPGEYTPSVEIKVSGATAPDGRPHICIEASGNIAWIPREAFIGSGAEALRMLRLAGMPLLSAEWAQCKAMVAAVVSYPRRALIARRGWNVGHFALGDGTVFSPTEETAVVLFEANSEKFARAGSIEEWRTLTAILQDQPIATFVLMAAYAGPFVSLINPATNPGFELAGLPDVGTTIIQHLAAAVCGPPNNPWGANYWITPNAAASDGLESIMAEHGDMPLIIEEFSLFAATERLAARASKINEVLVMLSQGAKKQPHGSARPQRQRFVFVTSGRETLSQVLTGQSSAVAELAHERMLTIPIGPERLHGIFDFLPRGFDNSEALTAHLNRAMRKCYGVGIRELTARLVVELAARPEAVARLLRRSMAYFRGRVKVDVNDGPQVRAADAFGLVFAAARFATRYNAVSKSLKPLEAAQICYELNRASHTIPRNPVDLLFDLADKWDTLEVHHGRLRELSDDQIESFCAIVRAGNGGRRELLLTERQLLRAFGNFQVLSDPEVRQVMNREEGRRQTKRQIRSNRGAERFFCFRLPLID